MAPKRPRQGEALTVVKRTRSVLSLGDKIKVLDCLKQGLGSSAVGRLFGVNESTIRTIKRNEEAIRASVAGGTPASSKCTYRARDPIMDKMEKELNIWMEDQARMKVPLSAVIIRNKAQQIYRDLVEAAGAGEADKFLASKGWFENFKKRYSLRNVKLVGEIASAVKEAAARFPEDVAVERIMASARQYGWEGFEELQSVEVGALLDSHARELTDDDLEEEIPSAHHAKQEEEVVLVQEPRAKGTLTLKKVNRLMQMAAELSDYALEIDPFRERSLRFCHVLTEGIRPYKEAQRLLRRKTAQPTLHAFFKAVRPPSSDQPGSSGTNTKKPTTPPILEISSSSEGEQEESQQEKKREEEKEEGRDAPSSH